MIPAVLAAVRLAAAAPAGPPAALRPAGVVAAGVYVRDLEAERSWYERMLGMHPVVAYPQYREVVLGYGPGANGGVNAGANLTLQASTTRPPGDNLNSRLVLGVPDAKGLAAWLAANGVPAREAVKDVAYFVRDPEGNPVELYTPPKP